MRFGLIIALALALASMAPRETRASEAPRVCMVLADHEGWGQAVEAATERWGTPPALLLAVIRQESNFRADKRSPDTVSPYGYPQAIRATWVSYVKSSGKPDARRNDFAASVDFIGWYLSGTKERTGLSYKNVTAHYMAYSRGPAPVGPASAAARRNAARVAAYTEEYERDLAACPLPGSAAEQVAAAGD